jgi:hypothetical protein
MANKTLHEFSAPTTANIRTGPLIDVGENGFKLKPALINMVQASQFCGKAREDASAHLQHFSRDLQHFHHQGGNQRCYSTRSFSIFTIRKGKAMVLRQ